MKSTELQRLRDGPLPNELPQGLAIKRISVQCPGNAQDVLARCREVLGIILLQEDSGWLLDDVWRQILPTWFVARFVPESTPEENAEWLRWWTSLSQGDRLRHLHKDLSQSWSLADWLYWLHPDNRRWHWWDATAKSDGLLSVSIVVDDWPCPWQALQWLLWVSGAAALSSDATEVIVPIS